MMGVLKDLARRGKDLALSSAAEKLAQKYLGPFGKIVSLTLDTSGRSMEATVLLNGETGHITLSVNRYEIIREADESYVIMKDIHASRQWIETVSRKYIQDRRFRIPDQAAKLLGFLS